MKNLKLSNRELCLIILLIFFGFIGIFSLYQLKNSESIEQSINNFNSGIASRYVNIVKEDEEDILNFLVDNIGNEFVTIPAMDYVFSECFPRFSDEGKASLYYYYYDNYKRFQWLYQDLIDVEEYRYYLKNIISESDDIDINDYEVYSKIDLTSLKTVMTELRESHFKLYPNADYFEVYFDYEWFYNEYKAMLPEEFVAFIGLEDLSMNPAISPNREAIDIYSIQDLVLASKDYLDIFGEKNANLRGGALQLFRSSLQYWLAGSDSSIYLYSDTEKYIISDEAYDYYKEFIYTYSESSLCILVQNVVSIMEKEQGKEISLTGYISPVIDDYLVKYGYVTEEEIEAVQESEPNYITYGEEYSFEDIQND